MPAIDDLAPAPLVIAAVAAVLYARGSRRQMRLVSRERAGVQRRRTWAFYASLGTVVVALEAPIDDLADRLFWVHMAQHLLLVMVAAPLLVLAAPWTPLWRGVGLGARRRVAGAYVRSPLRRPVRATWRRVAAPAVAWVLFNADMCAWHVPALYGLTLRDQTVHDLEHASFLALAVLFWAQVLDSPPLRARLDPAQRVAYVTLAATVAWLLAVVLAFAPSPLYAGYADLASRPGGLSALTDQRLAAGMMWGPGSIPYAVFVFVALYRWLSPPARGGRPRVRA